MFSVLVNSVFPVLGEFFGIVVALAETGFGHVLYFFAGYLGLSPNDTIIIGYNNLFTGVHGYLTSQSFKIPVVSNILAPLFDNIMSLFTLEFKALPFWAGLLISTVTLFFAIKFFALLLSCFR